LSDSDSDDPQGQRATDGQPPGDTASAAPRPGGAQEISATPDRTAVHFAPTTGRTLARLALAVALILLLGFALVFGLKWHERQLLENASANEVAQKFMVTVAAVGSGSGGRALTLPGETAAWYESTIYARVNGYVHKWYADIGDHVRQGQVLATIETPELDAQLVAARAQVNAAEAQVRLRQAEVALATTTFERWRDSPKGVVSEQEREEKKADYDSAQARLNAARAQVALNQADVDHYVALTEFKNVTAPFDGVIVERRIDIGNLVTTGSTAASALLYRVSQDRPIRVFVDVPQRASGELMKPGEQAQIRASNLPTTVFTGSVTRTSQAINPQARTLKVEIDLPNREGLLVPGMYVDVSFQLKDSGLFQVPAAAMVFRSSGPQVAVVDGDGHVHFRRVTIARDEGNLLELGSGVALGEKVALNISSQISDGDLVLTQEGPAAGPPAQLGASDETKTMTASDPPAATPATGKAANAK
jgi:RND family efflux transporter MFP subunit